MRRARPFLLIIPGLALVLLLILPNRAALAAGLNTDVALTPPEGGTIVRMQWRHSEREKGEDSAFEIDGRFDLAPITVVHGVTSDFSLLTTVPVVRRELDAGSLDRQTDEAGFADIPVLAKYRFYQQDQPQRTTRWAAIGGAEIPSFDEPFSSDSVDPIIGTVWTHQRTDWWIDWDLLYQFNTGGGIDSEDHLQGDAALSYRLLGGQQETTGPWGLYAIGEINAHYFTEGSHQVFGSPGVQIITPQWIIEAGVQLPIEQDMKAPRLETDFTTVLSVRFQF